jgi:hypothetical protein
MSHREVVKLFKQNTLNQPVLELGKAVIIHTRFWKSTCFP